MPSVVYSVIATDSTNRARVQLRDDGYFIFSVIDSAGGLVAAGGADYELPSLDALIQASHKAVDWSRCMDTARTLRGLELERYEQPVRAILARIFV